MSTISVFTDGGSRGNPGPAAFGVYITDGSGHEVAKIGKKIGEATNNVAEYEAILQGLNWLIENKEKIEKNSKVEFFMDSQLAYSQLNGLFKVKNENIRKFVFSIKEKEKMLSIPVFYNHIPREKNKKADELVNLALDNLI